MALRVAFMNVYSRPLDHFSILFIVATSSLSIFSCHSWIFRPAVIQSSSRYKPGAGFCLSYISLHMPIELELLTLLSEAATDMMDVYWPPRRWTALYIRIFARLKLVRLDKVNKCPAYLSTGIEM